MAVFINPDPEPWIIQGAKGQYGLTWDDHVQAAFGPWRFDSWEWPVYALAATIVLELFLILFLIHLFRKRHGDHSGLSLLFSLKLLKGFAWAFPIALVSCVLGASLDILIGGIQRRHNPPSDKSIHIHIESSNRLSFAGCRMATSLGTNIMKYAAHEGATNFPVFLHTSASNAGSTSAGLIDGLEKMGYKQFVLIVSNETADADPNP